MMKGKERIRKIVLASVLALSVSVMYCMPTAVMAADGTEENTTPATTTEQMKTPAKAQYTISFDLNGASGTAPEAKTVDEGSTVNFDTVSRDGYNFKGWSTDKNATTGTTSITAGETATYYAIWAKTYTVTFNVNGGDADAPETASYEAGASVTMPAYAGTNSGKTFVGWSTDKNVTEASCSHYTNKVYTASSTAYTMGKNNVTFYAVYVEKNITAKFFVRLDGKIPAATNGYSSNQYTPETKAMTVT
jgi:uncharacterized repeat protein (TIGR02543 family)